MYDEDEVNDSLDFCKDIKIYLEHDGVSDQYLVLHEYAKKNAHEQNLSFESQYVYKSLEGIQSDVAKEDDHIFAREVLKDLIYVSICIVVSFVFAYLITHFVAHHNMVEGDSMQPTLNNEDYLIIEKVSYYFHDPRRYDVVIFPVNNDVNYIKRIIGLPGEKVQIIEGEVYINGEKLNEQFGNEPMEEPGIAQYEIELGEDEYFVLGDNRNYSIDSRKAVVGAVKGKDILGRAWFRFYPFDSIGLLSHIEK